MLWNLCALCFVRALSAVHNGATPPWQLSSLVHLRPQRSYTSMTVKFACAIAAFCAIVRSNIVFILCTSALSHMNVFG